MNEEKTPSAHSTFPARVADWVRKSPGAAALLTLIPFLGGGITIASHAATGEWFFQKTETLSAYMSTPAFSVIFPITLFLFVVFLVNMATHKQKRIADENHEILLKQREEMEKRLTSQQESIVSPVYDLMKSLASMSECLRVIEITRKRGRVVEQKLLTATRLAKDYKDNGNERDLEELNRLARYAESERNDVLLIPFSLPNLDLDEVYATALDEAPHINEFNFVTDLGYRQAIHKYISVLTAIKKTLEDVESHSSHHAAEARRKIASFGN